MTGNKEKNLDWAKLALMSGKRVSLAVVAWLLIVFSTLGILGIIVSDNKSDSAGTFVFLLVMLAGGVWLLLKAGKTKNTVLKYKKYIELVVNQNVKSLDYIASAVGLPYDSAVKDLQKMINTGYLKNTYIHQGNREILLKQNKPAAYAQTPSFGKTAPQTKAVRCPGCDANNIVAVGKASQCEYCGNPLNA